MCARSSNRVNRRQRRVRDQETQPQGRQGGFRDRTRSRHRARGSRRGAGRTRAAAGDADHHRHEELPRAVRARPALQAGPRGEGLQGPVQGEHRVDRADRRVAPQRPRDAVSRVHGDHAFGHVQEEDAAEVGHRHVSGGEGPLREAGADAAQADTVPGPRRDRRAPDDGDEVRSEDRRRPAQGLRLEARRVPGVRDALATSAGEPLRRQERRLHASGRDQRLLAAQPGQGSGRGDLHDRPAADLDQVRRAQGAAQHVRLPACRARPLEEARGRERDALDLDAQSRSTRC